MPVCYDGDTFTGDLAGGSTITGTDCNDTLYGYESNNSLKALAGDDSLFVSGDVVDSNVLSGGDGIDLLRVTGGGFCQRK